MTETITNLDGSSLAGDAAVYRAGVITATIEECMGEVRYLGGELEQKWRLYDIDGVGAAVNWRTEWRRVPFF
jgi:hypothetical protein